LKYSPAVVDTVTSKDSDLVPLAGTVSSGPSPAAHRSVCPVTVGLLVTAPVVEPVT
jgi:hypothetical protein